MFGRDDAVAGALLDGNLVPVLDLVLLPLGQPRQHVVVDQHVNSQRRTGRVEALDATSAGLRVGYDDTSQFSREYKRLFGAPPMRNLNVCVVYQRVARPFSKG